MLPPIPVDALLDLLAKDSRFKEAAIYLGVSAATLRATQGFLLRKQISRLEARLTRLEHVPMEIYKQTDPRWAHLSLGNSPYRMGTPGVGWGCTTTAVAQLLLLAGWNITPGDVVKKLSAEFGYTGPTYVAGPGLIFWRNPGVEHSFPQFHFKDGGLYHLWAGRLGAYSHWVAEKDGVFYEPISGRSTTDVKELTQFCGAHSFTLQYACSIDAPPAPEPTPAENPGWHVSFPMTFKRTVTIKTQPWGKFLYNRTKPESGDTKVPHNPPKSWGELPDGTALEVTGAVIGELVEREDGLKSDKWYTTTRGNYFAAAYTDHPQPQEVT